MLGGDWTDGTMTDFKWRHFQGDVILWAVRWYCRYPVSYTHLDVYKRQGYAMTVSNTPGKPIHRC